MRKINKRSVIKICIYSIFILMAFACRRNFIPKPIGYFRISFPKKQYKLFDTTFPYRFEYPVYGKPEPYLGKNTNEYWMNIVFPSLNSKIYLTYYPLKNNLVKYAEDARKLAYKHSVKAESIPETFFSNPKNKTYGIIYDIKGNTATSLVFFVTDSLNHFLYGSLYFNSRPNKDSLSPVITFFRTDVVHMLNTLKWKDLQ